jgi:hypothetical protein
MPIDFSFAAASRIFEFGQDRRMTGLLSFGGRHLHAGSRRIDRSMLSAMQHAGNAHWAFRTNRRTPITLGNGHGLALASFSLKSVS